MFESRGQQLVELWVLRLAKLFKLETKLEQPRLVWLVAEVMI